MSNKEHKMKKIEPTFQIKQKETSKIIDGMFKNADIQQDYVEKQKWSELDDMYNALAVYMVEILTNVSDAVSTIKNNNVANINEVIVNVNTLTSDFNKFTDTLLSIKARHAGKVGVVKDGDDLALCLSVFQDYVIFNDMFKAITFPVIVTITEAIAEIMENIEKEKKLTVPAIATIDNVKDESK